MGNPIFFPLTTVRLNKKSRREVRTNAVSSDENWFIKATGLMVTTVVGLLDNVLVIRDFAKEGKIFCLFLERGI